MDKRVRPVLRSAGIFATVGAVLVFWGLTPFLHLYDGDGYVAALLIVGGVAFLALAGYFVWGFYYARRRGLLPGSWSRGTSGPASRVGP